MWRGSVPAPPARPRPAVCPKCRPLTHLHAHDGVAVRRHHLDHACSSCRDGARRPWRIQSRGAALRRRRRHGSGPPMPGSAPGARRTHAGGAWCGPRAACPTWTGCAALPGTARWAAPRRTPGARCPCARQSGTRCAGRRGTPGLRALHTRWAGGAGCGQAGLSPRAGEGPTAAGAPCRLPALPARRFAPWTQWCSAHPNQKRHSGSASSSFMRR